MKKIATLILLACLAAPALACQPGEWAIGPCCVKYAENYSYRAKYFFMVYRPDNHDVYIYLNYNTPQRCWDQAFKRWSWHVEWCQGYRRIGDGPTFPYDGCGRFVVPSG